MVKATSGRLPRGRYALSPEEVARIHRERLCQALADVMAEKGYVETSVQDVLREAVVSRRAFYELFTSKLDCFLAAFDYAGKILSRRILENARPDPAPVSDDREPDDQEPGDQEPDDRGTGDQRLGEQEAVDPVDRFGRAIWAYLDALADELSFARLFLIESYAAGPEAISQRASIQGSFAGALARVMGVTGPAGEYTATVIVAAIGSMVTVPVATGDPDAIRALGPPIIEHVRRLRDLGAFAEPGE